MALERCLYVVIDEIIGEAVTLLVSPWPRRDRRGRVRFDLGRREEAVGVRQDQLRAFLSRRRPTVSLSGLNSRADVVELSERGLAIGDAFAVELAHAEAWLLHRGELSPEGIEAVYDITPVARDLARASFYAAVAPTLEPDEVDRLMDRRETE
jgi:hypothetical protein